MTTDELVCVNELADELIEKLERIKTLWAEIPSVEDLQEVDAKAAALGVSVTEATRLLLSEKEPSMQFTTPEELGELALFLCSAAGNNVRGAAWNMDGGWAAQ